MQAGPAPTPPGEECATRPQPGFLTAFGLLLSADLGPRAWIVESDANPHAATQRQIHSVVLADLIARHNHAPFYERALAVDAEATWTYLDQLARRTCELQRMKAKETSQRADATRTGAARRDIESVESSVRETLAKDFLQRSRFIGRTMLTKRSLLSTEEYRSQRERVHRHVQALLQAAVAGLVS